MAEATADLIAKAQLLAERGDGRRAASFFAAAADAVEEAMSSGAVGGDSKMRGLMHACRAQAEDLLQRDDSSSSRGSAKQKRKILGAAAGVGLVGGALILGPFGALAGGIGAAYAATRKDRLGENIRTLASGAADAAESMWTFNKRHRLGSKARDAAEASYDAAVQFNREYRVAERASKLASDGWDAATDLNDKHKLTARAGNAAGLALDGVASLMRGEVKAPESRQEFERRLRSFWDKINAV